jgi:hypothetical protein
MVLMPVQRPRGPFLLTVLLILTLVACYGGKGGNGGVGVYEDGGGGNGPTNYTIGEQFPASPAAAWCCRTMVATCP